MFLENTLAYARFDGFPVTHLHSLIIPKRHVATFFELTSEEQICCLNLLEEAYIVLKQKDASIEGYNIGINGGQVAGQTIPHCHIHLIPRRMGDVESPRGGVRHIIPGKGYY